MSEIGKFKTLESGGDGEGDYKTDTITYELTYRPEHARYQQEAKIGAVEGRLHAVEKCDAEATSPFFFGEEPRAHESGGCFLSVPHRNPYVF